MSEPTAVAEPIDLPCIACDYNLRGLDRTGRCPECGQDVERSWQAHLAALADPSSFAAGSLRWQKRFIWGLRVTFWSGIAFLVPEFAFGFGVNSGGKLAQAFIIVAQLLLVGSLVGILIGMLMTAARRRLAASWQRWLRISLLLVIWLIIADLGGTMAAIFLHISVSILMQIWVTGISSGVAGLLCWCYWSIYFPGRLRRWMVWAGVANAGTSIASLAVGGLPMQSFSSQTTVGFPGVGCADALIMVARSVSYRLRFDLAVGVHLLAGLLSVGLLVMLWLVKCRAKRQMPV